MKNDTMRLKQRQSKLFTVSRQNRTVTGTKSCLYQAVKECLRKLKDRKITELISVNFSIFGFALPLLKCRTIVS